MQSALIFTAIVTIVEVSFVESPGCIDGLFLINRSIDVRRPRGRPFKAALSPAAALPTLAERRQEATRLVRLSATNAPHHAPRRFPPLAQCIFICDGILQFFLMYPQAAKARTRTRAATARHTQRPSRVRPARAGRAPETRASAPARQARARPSYNVRAALPSSPCLCLDGFAC